MTKLSKESKIFRKRRMILKWVAGVYAVSCLLPMVIVIHTHPFWDVTREKNPQDILITIIQLSWTILMFHLVGNRFFNSTIHDKIYTFFGGIKTHNFKFAHFFLWLTLISTLYYSVLTTDKNLGLIKEIIPKINNPNLTPENTLIFILSGTLSLLLSIGYIISYKNWTKKNALLLSDYNKYMTDLFSKEKFQRKAKKKRSLE
jgi:hypothetical protein